MNWNILLVDDSGTVRSMVAKTLQLAAVPMKHCFEASNGEEALDILSREKIDLALVDINMPVMGGDEMLHRMHRDPAMKDVPVVLLTSEGRSKRVEELQSEGFYEYLRKPVTPEKIREVVTRLVGAVEPVESVPELGKVVCGVIQRVAFVICDLAPKSELAPAESPLWQAEMKFAGPRRGSLSLTVPETVCDAFAANVIGLAPGEEGAHQLGPDALQEVVSVTCGHLLTALVGEGPSFRLEGPECRPITEADWQGLLEDADAIGCLIEDSPALLRITV